MKNLETFLLYVSGILFGNTLRNLSKNFNCFLSTLFPPFFAFFFFLRLDSFKNEVFKLI